MENKDFSCKDCENYRTCTEFCSQYYINVENINLSELTENIKKG